MLDIKLSPPREGARGGRDQFKWEDLKSHDLKDREHYLGHSVKVGLLERKNKFYKHDWYLKKDSEPSEADVDEVTLTRLYEEELMKEMMGLKPKRLMLLKSKPTDIKQLQELLNYYKKDLNSEKNDSDKKLHSSESRSSSSRSRDNNRTSSDYGLRSRSNHSYNRRKYKDSEGRYSRSKKNYRTDKYRETQRKPYKRTHSHSSRTKDSYYRRSRS